MKHQPYTFTIIISLILLSCSDSAPGTPAPNNDNALVIGDPMDCGLDSLTIFPVGCSYNPTIIENPEVHELADLAQNNANVGYKDKSVSFSSNSGADNMYDRRAEVEFVNNNEDDYDIKNLVFYNLITGESYPLVEDSIHILSFAMHKEFEQPLIFYRVVKDDYNEDERYDSHDPVMLYISNLDGSSFTKITPEEEYFVDYKVYEQTNSIMIKTAIDSNKDKKFLSDDETNFRSMNLNEVRFAENIFSDDIKKTLRKFN